jgi:hypothetical protein
MFNQISGHPMAQWRWYQQLNITVSDLEKDFVKTASSEKN